MKTPERMFAIRFLCSESKLGKILADIDNQVDQLGVNLVKEVAAGKNAPRGAFRDAIRDILISSKGPTTYGILKAMLQELGFPGPRVHSGVADAIRQNFIQRSKDDIITLVNGPANPEKKKFMLDVAVSFVESQPAAGTTRKLLSEHLVSKGFLKGSADTFIGSPKARKVFIVKDGIVRLKKGA